MINQQITKERRKTFSFTMNQSEKQMLETVAKDNYLDYAEQLRKLISDAYEQTIKARKSDQKLTAVSSESR